MSVSVVNFSLGLLVRPDWLALLVVLCCPAFGWWPHTHLPFTAHVGGVMCMFELFRDVQVLTTHLAPGVPVDQVLPMPQVRFQVVKPRIFVGLMYVPPAYSVALLLLA